MSHHNSQSPQTITILTANQRLSAYLRNLYDKSQQSQGLGVWESLDCLPLNQWLVRTYETLADDRLILSEAQELALWGNIITAALKKNEDFLLLRPFATAQLASEAWHLLKQWQLPLTLLKNMPSEDIQHFYQWAQTFQKICRKAQWIDHSDCADILMQSIKNQPRILPSHLILTGFEEVSPQITRLCDKLSAFTQIHWLPPGMPFLELLNAISHNKNPNTAAKIHSQPPAILKNIALLDVTQELRTMALWAKQELQNNPKITIGCVVPELNTLRAKVERIFTEIFTPAANGSSATTSPALPFNLSAGVPLHKYPLIRTAISILQLVDPELSIEHISSLLRSPFIGGAEREITQRAALDVSLRQPGERYLTLDTVLLLSKSQAPLWTQQLTEFSSAVTQDATLRNHSPALTDVTKSYLPSSWARLFIHLLEILGWPGERTLNSAEFQQMQRWEALLTEFTTLDLVINKPITFAAARDHLHRLAQHTLFQPQTDDLPIQVLGLLEASGLQFDRLWIMGMNDEYWPKSAAPNPFIPIYLQRTHNMPHASAERELAFSQKLTARFTVSAEQIIFSYSQRAGDTLLLKSALIHASHEIILNELLEQTPKALHHNECMELIQDTRAPQVGVDETVRGGASILKDQAACPFRAFARIRLGASKLPDITSGLSPLERGILLHEILEQVWKTLDNWDTLHRYDHAKLTLLTRSIVVQALSRKAKRRPLSLKSRFVTVETERLTQLITDWLQLEKKRPFFRVTQRETAHKIHFAGLELSLRIDREDELADGSHVLVDYKTGQPRVDDWFSERPDDPQLPLYCLTSAYPVHALLFAQVRVSQSQFKGISATETGITGVKPITHLKAEHRESNWEEFQLRQRQILERLVDDFLQGNAVVDPKKAEETCRNCELQMLCRVYETS